MRVRLSTRARTGDRIGRIFRNRATLGDRLLPALAICLAILLPGSAPPPVYTAAQAQTTDTPPVGSEEEPPLPSPVELESAPTLRLRPPATTTVPNTQYPILRLRSGQVSNPQSPTARSPATPLAATAFPHLMPTDTALARALPTAQANLPYDPTSVYDQKGLSAPRGFSVQAPAELVDPFSGNLILRHTDLHLPGVAGLDLTLQRVYNSKIHRNYAARASGDPQRIANGMIFVPTSPLGLGWNLHLGRLVGAVNAGPNNALPGPRYYERPDGSQHPFFQYTGPGCGDETTDVCLFTKQKENPYRLSTSEPWHLATADGRNITFGHEASDDSTIVYYATEIRDVHGNRIQIVYHDNTIPGIAVRRDYFRHFIDYIIDSAGRQIEFTYGVVNPPDVVRLTGITANGQSYSYGYSTTNPWPQTQAFLTSAQPPEGAPWRYEYRGLTNGECTDNSKRWCELTRITYPTGGTIEYTFTDNTFWTHGNPASVRAVATRQVGGRAITAATWSYQYNRENNYTGDEHTVITRPDGSKEVYTYFGVGGSTYDPWGSAWKAGALLKKEIRDANNQVQQTETYEWEPSPALSQELWGDPWIGLDTAVFVPRLRQRTIQRGSLIWTMTHTSFNDLNNAPRCTTEQGPDGATRYRLRVYYGLTAEQPGGLLFRFNNLVSGEGPYNRTPNDGRPRAITGSRHRWTASGAGWRWKHRSVSTAGRSMTSWGASAFRAYPARVPAAPRATLSPTTPWADSLRWSTRTAAQCSTTTRSTPTGFVSRMRRDG